MGHDTGIHWFINEDLGRGDVTTNLLLGRRDPELKAVITAHEDCVAAGLDEAEEVFRELRVQVLRKILDGEEISAGTEVMALQGSAKGILAGERVALNFLMRMSGIATRTRALVKRCRRLNPAVKIAATRKTTPGFRYYEKKAVALGWGMTHRFRLDDMVLIKDNHLFLERSISGAVRRVRSTGYTGQVEVEVTDTAGAVEAARAGADIVMLDNFPPAEAGRAFRAVKRARKATLVEVSGGITEKNILRYARHADIISLGALTHSARASNFSLSVVEAVEDEDARRARSLAHEMVQSLSDEMARESSARKRTRL
ncbi:MAG: carboxylating nicotinate-nucleotide diphosphorylase [Euryarchaeota archaeon]|nr:carboxylating nicotinate-nucleotide diphosphorylase [Euryarchaeota archaeon]